MFRPAARCMRSVLKYRTGYRCIANSAAVLEQRDDMGMAHVIDKVAAVKSVKELPVTEWVSFMKHISKLYEDKEYDEVLRISENVLQNRFDLPMSFYEVLLKTLEEHHPTRIHGELAANITMKLMEMGKVQTSNAHLLFRKLHRAVVDLGDPYLSFIYWHLSSEASLPVSRRVVLTMYEKLITLYMSAGDLESAIAVLKETAENGEPLSGYINEVLFLALAEAEDVDFAWELIHKLKQLGQLYSRDWGIFVSLAARNYHYPAVKYAFKNAVITGGVVLDDWCYNRMVEIGRRNGDPGMVRWAYLRGKKRKQVFEQGDQRITPYYLALIEALAQAGELESAFIALRKMGHGAESVRLKHLPQLASALRVDLSKSVELFLQLVNNPTLPGSLKTLLMNLMVQCFREVDVGKTVQFYQECLDQFDLDLNEDTIVTMLRHSQVDELLVSQLHYDAESAGLHKTQRIMEATVMGLQDSGYPKAADRYVEEMRKLKLKVPGYIIDTE